MSELVRLSSGGVSGFVADNAEFRRQTRRALREANRHDLAELITRSMIQTALRTTRPRRVKRVSRQPSSRIIRVAPNKGDPSPGADNPSLREVVRRGWSS
jgi:hypothetical protein